LLYHLEIFFCMEWEWNYMASLDIYLVVGHHVIVFLQILETSPYRRGAAEILSSHYYVSFFQERTYWSGAGVPRSSFSALRVCLHRVASPLHRLAMAPLAWLHRHPKYNPPFLIIVVARVTQLGVSRSKEIRLEVCRSLHIYNCICFRLSTYFGQPADA
jgi:hypothetical protein